MDVSTWIFVGVAIAAFLAFRIFKGYRSPRMLQEAAAAVADGAPLLDVRTPEEFQQGHHARAINIPLQELGGRMERLGDHSRPVVVYCHSGSRSVQAVRILTAAGFQRVLDLGPQRNTRHISEEAPRQAAGKIPKSRRRRR